MMTKAGNKILAGAKDALHSVRCDHEWERISTRIENGKITGQVDFCEKCKTRRSSFVTQQLKQES